MDQPALENRMSEEERRVQDAEVPKIDHDRSLSNWMEYKVPWTKIFTKRELNLRPSETIINACDNLWGINIKTLMEHLIEED